MPPLRWPTLLLYGVGEMAHSIKSVVFGLFILFFYTSVVGLPALWVGLATGFGLLWDAMADPYIGYLSDHMDLGYGRRHSFMIIGALTMGPALWALLSPPRGLPVLGSVLWLLVSSLLARSTSSLFLTPYYALGTELSADYHERTVITGVRGALALLATLLAASLSFLIFFPDRGAGLDPKLQYAGYPRMGFWFGLAMVAVAIVAIAGTWRWRRHLAPLHRDGADRSRYVFLREAGKALGNPVFLLLFLSSALFFLGTVVNANLSLYFLTYYLHITASAVLSALQLGFYVGALVGVAVWMKVSRYIEKRWLCGGAMFVCAAALAAAPLLFGVGHVLGSANYGLLFTGYAVVGFFGSVLWVLPASMLADVIDQDELHTNRRREGTYFGLYYFGQNIAASLSLLLSGALLDWFVGLVPGKAIQSLQTVERIGMLFGLAPAVLIGGAGALMVCYHLDHAAITDIQRQLQVRHNSTRTNT